MDMEMPGAERDGAGQAPLAVGVALAGDQAGIAAAIQASEQRYRALADSMPLIVWTAQPDGFVDYYNQRWFDYTGLTLEETQGWGWQPVLHPDDLQPCLDRWHAALRTGERYEMEHRFRRGADGTYRWHLGQSNPVRDATGQIIYWVGTSTDIDDQKRAAAALGEETETLATVNRIGQLLSGELDLQKLVQAVTDAATTFTGAQFGSFFYNVDDENGERYTLYTISGVPRSAFDRFPMPRNTHLFGPTFRGDAPIRLDDVHADSRYGQNPPYWGMPAGHLPVTSYLAVPVVARSGEVLGGLFFGHATPGVFTERAERLVVALAAQTAVAMDNARLYQRVQEALREREATIQRQQRLEEQLTLLVEASSRLIGTLQIDAVVPTILDLSRRLIAADAYAVWRFHSGTGIWQPVSTAGLSPAYQQTSIQPYSGRPPFAVPILAEDVLAAPDLKARREEYQQEGICSLLVVPLLVHGGEGGSIAFYYRQPRRFDEIEVRVATALANIAGAAMGGAELYEEQSRLRAEAEQAQARAGFLADVSQALAASLDYETTLQSVTRLTVPDLADWCTVEVPDAEGGLHPLALAVDDPAKLDLAAEFRQRYPPDLDAPHGLANVLRTGRSELVPEVTDAMLVAGAQDATHLAMLHQLNIRSAMFVPLLARGRVVGVLSLASSTSGRYGPADLALAEEVARRAGIAVDNARLYREAQEAIQIREEFLSIASHELKTPVTGLQLQVQMLLNLAHRGKLGDVPPDRLVTMLERSERQTKQLDKLINRLLDISRINAGRLELEREDVNLAELVSMVVERFGPELTTAGCALTFTAPGPVLGRWDRARIEQVVTNLLANAIKYGPGRPITVHAAAADGVARLVVRDEGIGIAPEHLDRIFDRFERAVPAHNYGGFGLGLYIVRQLVEAHGGTITVTSVPGQGATFTVELPLPAAA